MHRVSSKTLLRILIGILAYGFVLYRLWQADWTGWVQAVSEQGHVFWGAIALVVVLMVAVWAVETLKWRISTRSFMPISFGQAWRAVWFGAVVGLLTPNRIGEPLGRVIHMPPDCRGRAVAASVLCAMSQLLATVLYGAAGLVLWFGRADVTEGGAVRLKLVLAVFVGWVLLVIVALLLLDALLRWFNNRPWMHRLIGTDVLELVADTHTVLKVIVLSLFKYLIFSTQYVILLRVFGVDASWLLLYTGVAVSYLLVSFVPSVAATELAVRLGAAMLLLGSISSNHGGVAAASLTLWTVNIGIPVLAGVWMRRRR